MALDESNATRLTRAFPRLLGCYGEPENGPLVICIGGIHGNEPAGVVALQQVLQQLQSLQPPFRGQLVALSGNRAALARGRRYIEKDLNRVWFLDRIRALKSQSWQKATDPEDEEQREILEVVDAALEQRHGPVIFLDLHTTSAEGVPFAVIGDTLPNRRFAFSLHAPVILGLEEHLDGTTLNYINDLGYIAIGFEAGQHSSPSALENHEAAIWQILMTAGCVRPETVPHLTLLHERVTQQTRAVPRVLEVRYRHAIREDDCFVMAPGYTNFQEVTRGQLLAHDRHGEIRAQEGGYILMPLYQSQGTDGFFLVRAVHPFWLGVAAWVRRLRVEKTLPWLPGIQRHPERADTLIVNPHVARWFVLEIFHLLGFRRQRTEGEKLIVSRRRHEDIYS